jgi:hypothetical protein
MSFESLYDAGFQDGDIQDTSFNAADLTVFALRQQGVVYWWAVGDCRNPEIAS